MRLYKLLFACIFLLFTIGCSQELPPFKTQRVCKVPSIIEYTKTGTGVELSLKDDTTNDIKTYNWEMKERLTGLSVNIPDKSAKKISVRLTSYTSYNVSCEITTRCDDKPAAALKDTVNYFKDICKKPTTILHGIPPEAKLLDRYKFKLQFDGDTTDLKYVVWQVSFVTNFGKKNILLYTSDTLKHFSPFSTYQFGSGMFKITAYFANNCNKKDSISITYDGIYPTNEISVSSDMVIVDGGTFTMGSNSSDDKKAKPEHQVKVSTFKLSKYEVTQKLWNKVMPKNNSVHANCDNCPVTNVTVKEVDTFLKNLEFITGTAYRLPTEAEWEYAAKGGKTQKTYKYSGSDTLSSVAWYSENSSNTTSVVGLKKPNSLEIFDMTGNVWELVSDWYAPYSSTSQVNPKGPSTGTQRISRGGGYRSGPPNSVVPNDLCDNNFRSTFTLDTDAGGHQSGFRLALTP